MISFNENFLFQIKKFEAEHRGPVLYIAEKILKRRHSGCGDREYLVKWQGYDVAESTWEPLENLLGNETLYEFERNVAEMTKLINKVSTPNILNCKTVSV